MIADAQALDQVHPSDAGEGEWWLVEPPAGWEAPAWAHEPRTPPPSLAGTGWEYLAARSRHESLVQALDQRPLTMPNDWWFGLLEGLRLGLQLAQEIAANPPHDRAQATRATPTVTATRTRGHRG